MLDVKKNDLVLFIELKSKNILIATQQNSTMIIHPKKFLKKSIPKYLKMKNKETMKNPFVAQPRYLFFK
jgi:hypothetical protein